MYYNRSGVSISGGTKGSFWICYRIGSIGPFVRRDKALIFSGCHSHPASVVPAGSNRSGSGGNETAEAFDAKDRIGGSASRQAVT
jgi:hypothetical protein